MLFPSCSDDTTLADNPQCNVPGNVEDFALANGAFRFTGLADGASVMFHITAEVCLDDGSTSQCETECADCAGGGGTPPPATPPPFRKRRETVKEILATKYYLTVGPYKFANIEQVQKGWYLC